MQPVIRCAPLAALVGSGVTYLLKDEFTTNEAAPIASPRTCEPGPGTLTVVQLDGQLSIVSSALNFPAQATPAWYDQGFYSAGITRINGRAVLAKINCSTLGYGGIGWSTAEQATALVVGSLSLLGGALNVSVGGGVFMACGDVPSTGVIYQVVCILRATGIFTLVSGGVYGTFPTCTLAWITVSGTTTPMYASFGNYSAAGVLDDFRVVDLTLIPAPTVNVASPVSGTGYTATADAIHDLNVTAANPLAGTAELRYRVLDASNYWTAYLAADGSFNLDSVLAGVATNRITVAGVWTVGVTRTVRVIVAGTKHNCYTLAGTTWTKRGSEINVSHQDTSTSINATYSGGPTVANLISYNRVQTIDNV